MIRAAAPVAALCCLWLALAAPPALRAQAVEQGGVEEAVVLIEVTTQHGDWYTPWQGGPISRGSGSGFLIGPDTVMTNAHLVSDARQILVRRSGRVTPAFAEVAHVAHDADLALLKVQDPTFDEGARHLSFGDLPSLRTRVRTYGFPAGGEQISRTEGVISRVEFITYVHSGADAHMAIQTDSAINPGNSGGPVVQDGKVVGVAFQANTRLDNVGYFIPTPVIRRFLRDIEDGDYDGYAELGLITSNLFNPAYRAAVGLPDQASGVVVDRILPGSSAVGHVQERDVITAIGGTAVANDGTIAYRGHRLGLEQVVEDKLVGESVDIELLRDRQAMTLTVPLQALENAERLRRQFDRQPDYVIYAGLVFMELNQEYLATFGNYWANAGHSLLYSHFYEAVEQPGADMNPAIVLTRVLPHAVNSAYRPFANSIVTAVNGRELEALEDLPGALADRNGGFLEITLQGGRSIVLERDQADAAHPEILRVYGIPSDRRLQ